MFNYNINTEVNESEFDDLRCIDEITDKEQLLEFIGVPVILNRHKHDFETFMRRVVDIAGMCWSNPDGEGDVLEHTRIDFKADVDDAVIQFTIECIHVLPRVYQSNNKLC